MQSRMTKEEIPNLFTAEELAKKFNCNPMLIYRKAWKGEIPSIRIGRLRRFAPAAIAQLIEAGGTLDKAA
jgi:excisionase family DNA binding protein